MEPLEECQVLNEEVTPRRESSDSRTVQPAKRSSIAPVVPWERLSGESARAFAQFRIYRDLGPQRSIDATYHQCRPSAHAGRAPGPLHHRHPSTRMRAAQLAASARNSKAQQAQARQPSGDIVDHARTNLRHGFKDLTRGQKKTQKAH